MRSGTPRHAARGQLTEVGVDRGNTAQPHAGGLSGQHLRLVVDDEAVELGHGGARPGGVVVQCHRQCAGRKEPGVQRRRRAGHLSDGRHDHVGAARHLLGLTGAHELHPGHLAAQPAGEILRRLRPHVEQPYLAQPRQLRRQRQQAGCALHAAAEDADHRRARPGQQTSRQAGAGARAHGRQLRGVHDGQRDAGVGIAQHDQPVQRRQTEGRVVREQTDPFGAQAGDGERRR